MFDLRQVYDQKNPLIATLDLLSEWMATNLHRGFHEILPPDDDQ
jgi:hypothetical protein